jgi:hypothetical protein
VQEALRVSDGEEEAVPPSNPPSTGTTRTGSHSVRELFLTHVVKIPAGWLLTPVTVCDALYPTPGPYSR